MIRYEIVRSDAEQPWFAREVASNGKETWKTSENYTRPRGPSEAIVRHIRSIHPGIKVWWSNGTGGPELRVGMPGDVYLTARVIEVRQIDLRLHKVARPELPDLATS